ncbi:MAG: precorrin-3B C(17)-methyltransferase [Lachnospiraceae bacterium]|nr:precorrin-3B C(17)-methyltransferase [Lachnospiraceae bacterium]
MERVIYIIGMGPGDEEYLTAQAREALMKADVIVGYTLYAELMKKIFPDKEYRTTGMRMEVERCRLCYELCKEGKTVALICSGDAGVYGMASPMYEMLNEYTDIEPVVIPGITAALSGAAVLGAPLGHDHCIISLSDLLTPWEVIERRLKAATDGDFVTVLYNPSSKKRKDYLQRACDIMLAAGAKRDCACGYVQNIGREGTRAKTLTLEELRFEEVDMFTTVFIGNSESYIKGDKLITSRNYRI